MASVVTSDPGAPVSFDRGALGENGVFTFTSNHTGVVDHHSTPFENVGMMGTVIVR